MDSLIFKLSVDSRELSFPRLSMNVIDYCSPLFFADSVFLKYPSRIETMAMLMGLSLLVYTIGQRQLRANLKQNQTGVKNQLGKLTDQPTRPWIFQGFQGVHLVVLNGVKQIVNLTDSRVETINYFSKHCQKYYILSG